MTVRLHHPELGRDIEVNDRAVPHYVAAGWDPPDDTNPDEAVQPLAELPPPPAAPPEGA